MRTCEIVVDGVACDKPHSCRGMCASHYDKWRRHGDPHYTYVRPPSKRGTCTIENCDKREHAKGLCPQHYLRNRIYGDPLEPSHHKPRGTCSEDGCDDIHEAHGYCNKHYKRFLIHGDPSVVIVDTWANHGSDTPAYAAMHQRIKAKYGPARTHDCVGCGGQAADWSYDHTDPEELSSVQDFMGNLIEVHYSTDPEHYSPRCKSCHFLYDTNRSTTQEVTQ